jgi:hypothetical protein
MLDLAACDRKPEIGETVSIVPNHVCVVVNMVDQLVTVRGDEIDRHDPGSGARQDRLSGGRAFGSDQGASTRAIAAASTAT